MQNSYHAVLGEGSHHASIMFIGEAPGENEAKAGRPFCGAAGRMLDELLASIDVKREDVYITNIVKDRPPGNRDPEPDEIALYAPFLDRQVDVIQPKVVATLGRFSTDYIMRRFGLEDRVTQISAMHGQTYTATRNWGEVSIVPLYHPAVALYRNSMKATLMEDFKVIKSIIDNTS
jgi:DNA polymerase